MPEYSVQTNYLYVYSGDRDEAKYPDPNNYVIDLWSLASRDFKNVMSVTLVSGIFPDVNNIAQEPYIILEIHELDSNNVAGTSTHLSGASMVLQMDKAVSTGCFFNAKTDICKNVFPQFNNPITDLYRLSIKLRDCTGALFNFGSDTSPVTKSLQHLLVFEIKCQVPKRAIGHLIM